jgi:hypothetical protein
LSFLQFFHLWRFYFFSPAINNLLLPHYWFGWAWLGVLAVIILKNRRERLQEEHDRLLERKQNGLSFRDSSYKPANAAEWNQAWNWRRGVEIDWLEDQVQELQSGDIVLSFSKGRGLACWAGYAIERNGKIIAMATTYIS